MALSYSFYGGKSGVSYRLVEHFDSIKAMVDAFQQGGSYNDVNYGEYVIIDTVVNNKQYNNPENGIIYRRGLNYLEAFNPNNLDLNDNNAVFKDDKDSSGNKKYYTTDSNGDTVLDYDAWNTVFSAFAINPGGGAEYIGQIVGPQGEAPELSLIEWAEFEKLYAAETSSDIKKDSFEVTPVDGATFDNDGKLSATVDVIEYGYLDIKDANGNITGAYISMNIPHSVFKYHAESIEPYDSGYATYDSSTNTWNYTNLISEDSESQSHPYYWKYGIKIPKGIKGEQIEEFGLNITGNTLNDGNDVDQSDDNYGYYYTTRNFDKTAEGEVSDRKYVGYLRSIYKITDNGSIPSYNKVTRSTTYGKGQRVSADGLSEGLVLECIQGGITGSDDLTGLESKTTATGYNTVIDGTVIWQVVDDEVTTPNLITIHYTHGDNENVAIRVVDDILYNSETGRFYVRYSDSKAETYLGTAQGIYRIDYIDTPWVDSNSVSHTIDRIRVVYNTYKYDSDGNVSIDSDFSLDSSGNVVWPTTDADGRNIQWIDEQFKFVDHIGIDDTTKLVTVYYNDGTTTDLTVLKAVTSLEIENEGRLDSNKYFKATWDNGDTQRLNKNPLNDIASIQQYGSNIIVLYSDPNVRKSLYNSEVDYALPSTRYTIPEYTNTTGNDDGNGNLYWINLGSIHKGDKVFGSFDSLDDLNTAYPYGFGKDTSGNVIASEVDYSGWIATVKDSSGNLTTYAFDYTKGTSGAWYELQNLAAQSISPEWTLAVSVPADGSTDFPPDEVNNKLNIDGYWFVVSERED